MILLKSNNKAVVRYHYNPYKSLVLADMAFVYRGNDVFSLLRMTKGLSRYGTN